MFINCPFCNALVATDPINDAPPEHCPRCAANLRKVADTTPEPNIEAAEPVTDTEIASALPSSATAPVADAAAVDATLSQAPSAIADDASATDIDALSEAILGPAAVEADIAVVAHEEDATSAAVNANGDAFAPNDGEDSKDAGDTGEFVAADASAAAVKAREAHRIAKPAPSFVRATGTRPHRAVKRDWRSIVAIGALLLLLALQSLLADRAALAANAHWRPVIAVVCNVLRCTVPPWREPAAFTLIARDVRPHPTVPGALRVTASFRNDAHWSQPWPRLALTLSDVDGREAGKRDFGVAEYLGAAPAQTLLKPGQVATIAMDVIEPAPRIVAFTFDFH